MKRTGTMTLIVGLNLGYYVLLGADTRVVCRYADGSIQNEDNAEKIQRTGLGLITGAGLMSLVESAETLLAGEDIAHVDRLVEILEQERTRVLSQPLADDADNRRGIEHTNWMFSYRAAQNANKPQLAMTGRFGPNNWVAAILNQAWLLTPAGTTPEQAQVWMTFANENLRALERPEDFDANLAYHRQVVGRLMKMVADVNQSVAGTFRLGVDAVPNRVGISDTVYRWDGYAIHAG
jgi:hypothetical protein